MYGIVFFNMSVVLFAYLAYKNKDDMYLKISFILIFLFLSLRYEYGNDYINYLTLFKSINDVNISSRVELGWQLLCYLFKPFGFFMMLVVLAGVQCVVYYRFIKKYVASKYYSLALFLYLFTPTCFLITSSAMRQSVAIVIFVYAIDYIYKRDFFKYLICIIAASLFHGSAIVLLPVYVLGVFDLRINKFIGLILFALYPLLYFFLPYLQYQINQIVSLYFNEYEIYLGAEIGKMGTGLGFLFNLIIYALFINRLQFKGEEQKLLLKLAILSYLVMPFGFVNPMVGRINMYLQPILIVAFISVLFNIKENGVRYSFIMIYSFIAVLAFYGFITSETWSDSFGVYKTILSAERIY